jgi:hypothetical protein
MAHIVFFSNQYPSQATCDLLCPQIPSDEQSPKRLYVSLNKKCLHSVHYHQLGVLNSQYWTPVPAMVTSAVR